MTNLEPIAAMPTQGTTESGGEIKMRRTLPPGRGLMASEIVLAYLPHNDVTPIATWQRNIEDGSTYWGHYFSANEGEQAVADFLKRGR
jgi:hypothetical protein